MTNNPACVQMLTLIASPVFLQEITRCPSIPTEPPAPQLQRKNQIRTSAGLTTGFPCWGHIDKIRSLCSAGNAFDTAAASSEMIQHRAANENTGDDDYQCLYEIRNQNSCKA